MSSQHSGLLVVTIEMPSEEFAEDGPEIISVEGNRENGGDGKLSDVEWFEEEWSNIGPALLYDEEEPPAYGQRHTFQGYLAFHRDYWGECDVEWVEVPDAR